MKTIKYLCDAPGRIMEKKTEFSAMFVSAKKYEILYEQALPRFAGTGCHATKSLCGFIWGRIGMALTSMTR